VLEGCLRYNDGCFAGITKLQERCRPAASNRLTNRWSHPMFNIQQMMKQAQKMQDQMKDVQAEMERTEFTGKAGGNAVQITCNGKYQFLNVKISPEALEDSGMLEDLIQMALNDLSAQVTGAMESKMSSITAGLNIPGLKLPF
jgi:nucleoid-associated protein EbfC